MPDRGAAMRTGETYSLNVFRCIPVCVQNIHYFYVVPGLRWSRSIA